MHDFTSYRKFKQKYKKRTIVKKEMKKKPEYKDPRIERHYPSRTKPEIFQQYFQLAAHAKGANYAPMPINVCSNIL